MGGAGESPGVLTTITGGPADPTQPTPIRDVWPRARFGGFAIQRIAKDKKEEMGQRPHAVRDKDELFYNW